MGKNFDQDNLKSLGKGKGGAKKPEDMATDAAADLAGKAGGEGAKDLAKAAIAVGAALAGKWDTAIKNGLEVLRKRWVEICLILCLLATETVLQWVIIFVIIISPIAATYEAPGAFVGWINDNTIGRISQGAGRGGSSLCPVVSIPSWSVDALKESGTITTKDKDGKTIQKNLDDTKQGGCYGKLLKKEAQKTGVPWELIAAIDFRYIEDAGLQGCYDCFVSDVKGAEKADVRLEKVGSNLQIANAWRKESGELIPDVDGNIQHKIDPDGKYLIGEAQVLLSKYHCLNITKKSEGWCFDGKYQKERYDFYTKDHWLWDGFDEEGYKDRLGVLGWYKNQTDNGKGCSYVELFRDPNAKPDNSIPSGNIQLLLQGDPRWGSVPYANANGNTSPCGGPGTPMDTMASAGCGITSLAMVLNTFGANVTPGDLVAQSYAVGGVADCVGAKFALYADVVNRFYPQLGLDASLITWAQAQSLLEQGKPIVVNNHMYGGHFIVLASKKGDSITVYDPANVKPNPYNMTVGELEGFGTGGGIQVYIRKKGQ